MIYIEMSSPPELVTVGSIQVERESTDMEGNPITYMDTVETVNGVPYYCDFYGEMLRIQSDGTVTVVNVGGY
jgi:hypothetical protein